MIASELFVVIIIFLTIVLGIVLGSKMLFTLGLGGMVGFFIYASVTYLRGK